MASQSRRASKEYVRERSNILVSAFAKLMDYWRHGTTEGASDEKLWNHKAKGIGATECVINRDSKDRRDVMWDDMQCERVCAEVLKSATKTNEAIDNIAGMKTEDKEQVKPHSHHNAEEVRPEL